jgi:low temperature requirement protein LtrA
MRTWVWLAALVLDYAGPYLGHWTPGLGRTRPSEWELEPSHFVERIELFMIIALGESIMAIGVIAGALDLTAARVLAVVVAFGITVGLWWLYFDFHAERALEMLRAAASERGRLGRELTYIHIPMVAGVITTAVANELVVAHPDHPLPADQRWMLAAGPALYLLGSVGFKRRILQAPWQNRTIAAAAAVAAPFLGSALPSLAVWSIALAILAALAATEAGERRRVAIEAAVLEDEAVEVVES